MAWGVCRSAESQRSAASLPWSSGFVGIFLAGTIPTLGDSAADIAAYYSKDGDVHRIYVVISVLLAVPIALFLVGVYQSLQTADRDRRSPWPTLFLFGAIMSSATAGMSEGLYAILALRGGAGLEPETLRALNDGYQIAQATLPVWLAVAIEIGRASCRERV